MKEERRKNNTWIKLERLVKSSERLRKEKEYQKQAEKVCKTELRNQAQRKREWAREAGKTDGSYCKEGKKLQKNQGIENRHRVGQENRVGEGANEDRVFKLGKKSSSFQEMSRLPTLIMILLLHHAVQQVGDTLSSVYMPLVFIISSYNTNMEQLF